MIQNQKSIEKAMIREAYRRTECPELRKDMVQQAWLEILESKSKNNLPDGELGKVIKTRVVPSMSKYYWSNRCAVSCSRPRKGVAAASNVPIDVLEIEGKEVSDIIIDANKLEELGRRHYCEFQMVDESRNVLDDREFGIIEKRFLSDKKATRKNISVEIGVSTERVRQIEMEALEKLKERLSYQ